ncbi:MAG TPA: Ig-like domain-containing protein, partial [Acidimicrobiales bacterium]|nr:Ig-like domain-containing protein [Acidimicrobiales bacterium]
TVTLPATTCIPAATALAGGSYAVSATYNGDTQFTPSTSAPTGFTVGATATATSLVLSSASVLYGTSPVFTAQVSSAAVGSPTGTVTVETYLSGSPVTLCTVTLPATTCSGTGLALPVAASPYSVLAVYSGDASFLGSTSPSQNLTVTQEQSSTTVLSLTPNSAAYGNESSVGFNVTVQPETAGTPTGTVTLQTTVGGNVVSLCTATLSGGAGSCTTGESALAASANPYAVTAVYGGDSNFSGSTSTATNLTITRATTTTQLQVVPATVTYGDLATEVVTATVDPQFTGTPTGTVTITSGATTLCTVTLIGGTGTCSPAAGVQLPTGTHDVTATYGGDTNFGVSSHTDTGSLTVNGASSTTEVGVAPSTVPYGAESTATFSVTVVPEFSGVPTGAVTLTVGSTTLCVVTLAGGSGTCSPANAALGAAVSPYTVTAAYSGDANFTASAGATSLTVAQTAASLSVTSGTNPSFPGRPVTFTAPVTTGQGLPAPTGTVTFTEGAVTLCSAVPLVAGQAVCTATLPITPTQTIDAAYSGDSTFAATSTTYVQHVEHGYWTVAKDGGVFAFGQAQFYGSMGGKPLNEPVVGIASTGDGGGYWLVASDGGIFNFGDAGFYGSTGSMMLSSPIVAMQPTPDGKGYWLVARGGGVYAFGDAGYFGSMSGKPLPQPIVGMVATADGKGYFLVSSNGAVYAFGDAQYEGSTGFSSMSPVVGLAATPSGAGYWLATSNGGVANFGDARSFGPTSSQQLNNPVVGIGATSDGGGYWLVAGDGGVFAYGDAIFDGSTGNLVLNSPMVSIADI